MKLNPCKTRLFLNTQDYNFGTDDYQIHDSICEWVDFDYTLKCTKHIQDTFQKASRKLNAVAILMD